MRFSGAIKLLNPDGEDSGSIMVLSIFFFVACGCSLN